jgi:hypothetical protein
MLGYQRRLRSASRPAREEGDWLVVAFTLPTRGFQLEYYDTLPADASGQRQFTYTYAADYETGQLDLDFQVPPTAEGFALDPPADSEIREGDGLVYHVVDAGALAQGEERQWTFTYIKSGSDLTAGIFEPSGQAGDSTATTAPPAESQSTSTFVIFLVAFVALVAVGAGAYWLGRRTQPPPPPPSSSRTKRRGSGRGSQAQGAQDVSAAGPMATRQAPLPREVSVFCYQCGAELRPDSEFCHRCGVAVRDE